MSNQEKEELPILKVSVPSFLLKTYEILEVIMNQQQNSSLEDIISWNNQGTSFIVYNTNELSSKVLPNYFKHKNYPSFLRYHITAIRQLNMYNFKKTKNAYNQSEFRHKWFRKGLKSMLQYIRRRNQEESDHRVDAKTNDLDLDSYKKEHQLMKADIRSIINSQQQMQLEFTAAMEQNATYHKQNAIAIQQFHQSQAQNQTRFNQISMSLARIVSSSESLQYQIGDFVRSIFFQEDSIADKHEPLMLQFNDNYSRQGSPYPYIEHSPLPFIFASKQNFYDYHFDQRIIMSNIFQNQDKFRNHQLALPPIIYPCNNNYSCSSSQQNSPFRVSNLTNSSTTESKASDKVIITITQIIVPQSI